MTASSPPILILCRDLMFSSKTTAAARALGAAVKVIRDPAELKDQSAAKLIVDLSQPGALEAAVAWKAATAGQVIGFVSHADTATIQQARSAGLDQVLTRGQFSREIERLLSLSA